MQLTWRSFHQVGAGWAHCSLQVRDMRIHRAGGSLGLHTLIVPPSRKQLLHSADAANACSGLALCLERNRRILHRDSSVAFSGPGGACSDLFFFRLGFAMSTPNE